MKKKESVIQPTIHFVGNTKEHALEELFNNGEAPLIKSVGYVNLPGTTLYVSYIIHSRGTEIVKIEVEEPNVKMIAEDSAKVAFVNTFCNEGFMDK